MYLISVGEIFLKGNNRNLFEKKLIRNLRKALELKPEELQRYRNRYIITNESKIDNIQRVFGVYSYAKTIKCKLNLEAINELTLSLIKNEKTFRISSKRLHSINMSSTEVNEKVGEFILKNKTIKVDLKNPEVNIHIEEVGKAAYLYTKIIKGPGGLPVGSSGFVFLRVNDEIKSTVAAYLMMKRGCIIAISKELPEIQKFEYGGEIRVREEKDNDFIVVDETFKDINLEEEKKFVMSPLIGYSDREIKEIYNKIKLI